MMFKKRLHCVNHGYHQQYCSGNNYLRYRRSGSRNGVEPSHESINSIERKAIEKPLRYYEKVNENCPPTELTPIFNPSNAFKEDVLKIVTPLLENLKSEKKREGRKSDQAESLNPQQVIKNEVSKNQFLQLQNRFIDLEEEIKVLKLSMKKIQPEKLVPKVVNSPNPEEIK